MADRSMVAMVMQGFRRETMLLKIQWRESLEQPADSWFSMEDDVSLTEKVVGLAAEKSLGCSGEVTNGLVGDWFALARSKSEVILINGQFPGPTLEVVTNDNNILNLVNKLDQPFLLTWNGIKQRKNSS